LDASVYTGVAGPRPKGELEGYRSVGNRSNHVVVQIYSRVSGMARNLRARPRFSHDREWENLRTSLGSPQTHLYVSPPV
jgi:hypothetical protein